MLREDESVVASLLLRRCQAAPLDIVKLTSSNNLTISATEDAQQSYESMLEFARIWILLCGSSQDLPSIVFIDGNFLHVTRAFIELAVEHRIYVREAL